MSCCRAAILVWSAGDDEDEGGVASVDVREVGDVVGDERTASACRTRPVTHPGFEERSIDHQLPPPGKELHQLTSPSGPVKRRSWSTRTIGIRRRCAASASRGPGQLLLADQQLRARLLPLGGRHHSRGLRGQRRAGHVHPRVDRPRRARAAGGGGGPPGCPGLSHPSKTPSSPGWPGRPRSSNVISVRSPRSARLTGDGCVAGPSTGRVVQRRHRSDTSRHCARGCGRPGRPARSTARCWDTAAPLMENGAASSPPTGGQ